MLTAGAEAGRRGPARDPAASVLLAGRPSRPLDVLARSLVRHGFDVARLERPEALDGPEAVERTAGTDVVLLHPGDDPAGLLARVCARLDAPVIALGPRRMASLEAAFDAGADDYVAAPYAEVEVVARIGAALRRRRSAGAQPLQPAPVTRTSHFTLDLVARRATTPTGPVHLTPNEWKVVDSLARRPGTVISARHLQTLVWGADAASRSGMLKVCLSSVRRKLEPDPRRPRYFVTERGSGFRFVPGPLDAGA